MEKIIIYHFDGNLQYPLKTYVDKFLYRLQNRRVQNLLEQTSDMYLVLERTLSLLQYNSLSPSADNGLCYQSLRAYPLNIGSSSAQLKLLRDKTLSSIYIFN